MRYVVSSPSSSVQLCVTPACTPPTYLAVDESLRIPLDENPGPLPSPRERRQLRQATGMRLVDVARVLHVDTSTVSRWERGFVDPHGSARLVYVAFLDRLAQRMEGQNEDTPPGGTDGASKTNENGVRSRAGYRLSPFRRST
jgi:DNA-binding XRE family transcriptional regulator